MENTLAVAYVYTFIFIAFVRIDSSQLNIAHLRASILSTKQATINETNYFIEQGAAQGITLECSLPHFGCYRKLHRFARNSRFWMNSEEKVLTFLGLCRLTSFNSQYRS